MSYQVIQPCEELKDFVSHFWIGKWNNTGQASFDYFSTANTHTELAFAFRTSADGRPELVFSSVLGHTKNSSRFPMGSNISLLGASLYSYAIPSLFNISASELTNQFLDLDTFLSKRGKMLNEQMSNAASPQERLSILSGYFRIQVAKKSEQDCTIIRATRQIEAQRGIVNIQELAAEFNLSQKQFERRFAAYSAFNPKLYARIVRFEAALWDRRRYNSLTEVAHAYGYYDQAHFIHDFKTFSGFSPNKFFSLSGY
ncbi:MAG TPA: AraC family transcriptional regulator [Flavitalea sp.]|nr:AraC family transcriptional regulator [Flavitalea sp.]